MVTFQKRHEFTGYNGAWQNRLKFCKAGRLVVFGTSGSNVVIGVGVLASTPVTQEHNVEESVALVPEDLKQHLRKFLQGYRCFDYCTFAKVYDVRQLGLSWSEFAARTGAVMPKTHQGFPTIAGAPGLRERVLDLCASPKVTAREWCMSGDVAPIPC